MNKDYNIPMSQFGFHGTGVYSDDIAVRESLKKLLNPIQDDLVFFEHFPPHISTRYLGYVDDVPHKKMSSLIPKLKQIYSEFLPISVTTGTFRLSWQVSKNPHRSKRIMLSVESDTLKSLHKNIMSLTTDIPLFAAVEGANYQPHISIAKISNSSEEKIKKVENFISTLNFTPQTFQFSKCYIAFTDIGMQEIPL